MCGYVFIKLPTKLVIFCGYMSPNENDPRGNGEIVINCVVKNMFSPFSLGASNHGQLGNGAIGFILDPRCSTEKMRCQLYNEPSK